MVGHEAFMNQEESSEVWEPISSLGLGFNLEPTDWVFDKRRGSWKNVQAVTRNAENEIHLWVSNASVADVSRNIDSSTAGSPVKSGKYIYSENILKTPDSSMLLTDATVKSLVNNICYELTSNGTLNSGRQFKLDVSLNAPIDLDVTFNTIPAEVTFILDNSTFKLTYNVNYKVEKVNNASVAFIDSVDSPEFYCLSSETPASRVNGINFLSYNYIHTENDGVIENISSAKYFSDQTLWQDECPVSDDTKNMFILTDPKMFDDKFIKLGDYLKNITYNNESGKTEEYQLIPGLTKVIRKQFVQVNNGEITYQGHSFKYNSVAVDYKGNYGFYLISCTSPVLIENGVVTRQLPISDDRISESLRFIPMKGLTLTSKHRPGYDANGNLNIEEGIDKVYKVLDDEGIKRGLMNDAMVNYRYIIDSMSYGLGAELGGKVWLSRTAMKRQKCTAILNLPSAKQFAVSSNPYFCDTYTPGAESRPSMNTKYIPEGGNTEMGSTVVFSLPSEEDGGKFTACFWPHLLYKENGREIIVPPAADVANVLNRKFNGLNDPYAICANQNGILSSRYLAGLEFLADKTDREYLEPFGVNTIIKDQGSIMIYGNQTAYQSMKSDFNKLHIRENLNTAEIECEKVLKKYNFLYNTPATRANIVQQLTPVLQAMQIAGALAKYDIICDETNNTPEVIEADTCVVEINLWMNHGMEKIVQVYTLQRLTDQ